MLIVLSRVNTFQQKISAERGARDRGRSLRERNQPILGPSWNDQGTFRREFRLFTLCVLGLEIEKILSTQDQMLYPVQRFSKRLHFKLGNIVSAVFTRVLANHKKPFQPRGRALDRKSNDSTEFRADEETGRALF